MKLQLWALLVFIATTAACRKEVDTNMNQVASETGYLLSAVIEGTDTTIRAEYNNKNQLVKLVSGPIVCDSITYNSNGQLISCRHIANTVDRNVFRTSFTYRPDSIQGIVTDSASWWYKAVRLYTLMDKKITSFRHGSVFNGSINFSTINYSYLYRDSNLVKCIHPMPVANYEPIDTFAHHSHVYNPYRTLGEHVWILVKEITGTYSNNILLAESKNLASVESHAYYSVSNTTLNSSGINTSRTTVISTMEENKLLPTLMKRIDDTGVEKLIQFIYIKKK